MKRLLPWMLVAVVVVALFVLLRDWGPRSEVAPTAVPGLEESAPAVLVSSPDGASPDDRAGNGSGEELRTAVLETPRETVAAVSAQGGLWIEVVFADDGAPAAGARVQGVLHLEGELHSALERWETARQVALAAPAAPGGMVLPWRVDQIDVSLTADAAGRVHLREAGPSVDLRAEMRRDGVLYRGERNLSFPELTSAERQFRMELHPAFEGSVRVLDAEGAPLAGVAVVAFPPKVAEQRAALSGLGYAASPGDPPELPEVLASAFTDAEGRASLIDPSNRVLRAIEAGEQVAVQALVLLDPPLRAPLLAGRETVLRLPPMGSVTVEMPPGKHAQLYENARVALSLDGGAKIPFERLYRSMDGGRTHFAHVGLGLRLAARVNTFSDHGPYAFDGPTVPGQELRFVLPEALGIRVVEFQLVNESGAVLSNTGVRMVQLRARGPLSLYQVTDDAGRLRVECGNPISTPTDLHLHTPSALHEGSLRRTLEAHVDLSPKGPLPQGLPFCDGGVLVMRPRPLLVSGRVVDGSGAGIAGAMLEVVEGPLERGPSAFGNAVQLRARSDQRGEFLIEGDSPGTDPHLLASARGFGLADPRPIVPGERGLQVVLGSAGAVRVTLLLPEGLQRSPAKAHVVRGRAAPLDLVAPRLPFPRTQQHVVLQRDKLEPGPWTLEVFSVADEVPIVRMDAEVPDGGTVDLGEVDLTELLATLEVRATTADGEVNTWLSVRRVDGDRSIDLGSTNSGPLFVPKPPDGAVVELSAQGCLPKRATVSGPLLEVVLEKVRPARLVLPPGLRLPSKRLPVALSFERLSGDQTQGFTPMLSIEAKSEYEILLGAPGRFRLSMMDFSKGSNQVLGGGLTHGGEFEVRAVDLEQNLPVELPVDVSEWLKMLERHDGP